MNVILNSGTQVSRRGFVCPSLRHERIYKVLLPEVRDGMGSGTTFDKNKRVLSPLLTFLGHSYTPTYFVEDKIFSESEKLDVVGILYVSFGSLLV